MTNAEYIQRQGVRFADLKWRASGREEFDILAGAQGMIGHVRMDKRAYADPRLVWLDRERWSGLAQGGDERNDEDMKEGGTMTNAEWCIKAGMKFKDIYARWQGYSTKTKILDYNIMNTQKDVIGTISCDAGSSAEDALREWLDMPHHEKSILDDAEKKYLKAVIRPWRDRVEEVHRTKSNEDNASCIVISLRSERVIVADTMYKGMAEDKAYAPEELGI